MISLYLIFHTCAAHIRCNSFKILNFTSRPGISLAKHQRFAGHHNATEIFQAKNDSVRRPRVNRRDPKPVAV